jgi:heptosyltransferase-2
MPSSLWKGKRWPVKRYLELIQNEIKSFPVILGSTSDRESMELVSLLKSKKIPHFSGVGIWNLMEVAQVLCRSKGYIGNDTGIAHLAEAIGVKASVIFGPTVPDMGFGPWRAESRAIGSSLWCRPCSKDGSGCFRPIQRYRCLNDLSADEVAKLL